MTFKPMQDLPAGAEFVGPNKGTRYRVLKPASDHELGWVDVWNLSMSREEELKQITAGNPEPRVGFFAFSHPVDVEVIS